MAIYTNSLIVHGHLGGSDLYANTLAPGATGTSSNLNILADVMVQGNMHSTGRLDQGTSMYMTMRLSSNVVMAGATEHIITGDEMYLDAADSDPVSLANAVHNIDCIYNSSTGIFTVPVDGLYNVQFQGAFSNSVAATRVRNGVYFYLPNHTSSNARVAPCITPGDLVYTSMTSYFLAGDQVRPVYYSNDSNAVLQADADETFISFSIASTFTPTHSNYARL